MDLGGVPLAKHRCHARLVPYLQFFTTKLCTYLCPEKVNIQYYVEFNIILNVYLRNRKNPVIGSLPLRFRNLDSSAEVHPRILSIKITVVISVFLGVLL